MCQSGVMLCCHAHQACCTAKGMHVMNTSSLQKLAAKHKSQSNRPVADQDYIEPGCKHSLYRHSCSRRTAVVQPVLQHSGGGCKGPALSLLPSAPCCPPPASACPCLSRCASTITVTLWKNHLPKLASFRSKLCIDTPHLLGKLLATR